MKEKEEQCISNFSEKMFQQLSIDCPKYLQEHEVLSDLNTKKYFRWCEYTISVCFTTGMCSFLFAWNFKAKNYSFVPNCRGQGEKNCKFREKNSQLHLIIIRAWLENTSFSHSPILRDLDNPPIPQYILFDHLSIPLGENVPPSGNNLFAACVRNVGKKTFEKEINLWSNQLIVKF